MQEYIMPSDEQMKLMSQEYERVLSYAPKVAKTRFAFTLPIYLVQRLQTACDYICEVMSIVQSLENEEFYMRNKEIFLMIVDICHSSQRQLEGNYQYISSYCNAKSKSTSSLKVSLYKIMKMQGQILKELYTIFSQTKIKVFESIYQQQMLASIQLHSICI